MSTAQPPNPQGLNVANATLAQLEQAQTALQLRLATITAQNAAQNATFAEQANNVNMQLQTVAAQIKQLLTP